jgi:hypothetical protein
MSFRQPRQSEKPLLFVRLLHQELLVHYANGWPGEMDAAETDTTAGPADSADQNALFRVLSEDIQAMVQATVLRPEPTAPWHGYGCLHGQIVCASLLCSGRLCGGRLLVGCLASFRAMSICSARQSVCPYVLAQVRPYLTSKFTVTQPARARSGVVFGAENMSFRKWLSAWLKQLVQAATGWTRGLPRQQACPAVFTCGTQFVHLGRGFSCRKPSQCRPCGLCVLKPPVTGVQCHVQL